MVVVVEVAEVVEVGGAWLWVWELVVVAVVAAQPRTNAQLARNPTTTPPPTHPPMYPITRIYPRIR